MILTKKQIYIAIGVASLAVIGISLSLISKAKPCIEGETKNTPCADGTSVTSEICTGGKFIPTGNVCTDILPECEENQQEYTTCNDPTSLNYGKTRLVKQCIGGKWTSYLIPFSWCAPQICNPGEEEVIEYCSDGITPYRRRICQSDGTWMEALSEVCPAPLCSPGTEEIVDYCSDGITIHSKRTCQPDGTWVIEYMGCPGCTNWVDKECSISQRLQERNCNGNVEQRLVDDPTCCGDWVSRGCYPDTGMRLDERTCGGDVEQRLVADSTCATLNITVNDADTNQPLSGASVSLPDLGLSCLTGVNGFCAFQAPSGQVNLCVTKEGYKSVYAGVGDCFTTDVPASMTVYLTRGLTARVEVTVRDRPTWQPLAGATVRVTDNGTGETQTAITGIDGYLKFTGFSEGASIEINVEKDCYEPQRTGGYASYITDVGLYMLSECQTYQFNVGVHSSAWGHHSIGGANISLANTITGEILTCTTDAGGFCDVSIMQGIYDLTVSAANYYTVIQHFDLSNITGNQGTYITLDPFECTPGTTKCAGADDPSHPGNLYSCDSDGHWQLLEQDNVDCISSYSGLGQCVVGHVFCLNSRGIAGDPDSYDYWVCENGVWTRKEVNSERCGYPQPEPLSEGTVTISGKVTDRTNGMPLPGAKVKLAVASSGGHTGDTIMEATADENGDYLIEAYIYMGYPMTGYFNLVASYPGLYYPADDPYNAWNYNSIKWQLGNEIEPEKSYIYNFALWMIQ